MRFLKKMAIKSVTKKRTKELISYLEDGPKIDFLEALKRYNKEEVGVDYVDCSDWVQLFLHIIWFKVTRELYYDPTIGSDDDANLIGNIVTDELRKWEKVIRIRAGKT